MKLIIAMLLAFSLTTCHAYARATMPVMTVPMMVILFSTMTAAEQQKWREICGPVPDVRSESMSEARRVKECKRRGLKAEAKQHD